MRPLNYNKIYLIQKITKLINKTINGQLIDRSNEPSYKKYYNELRSFCVTFFTKRSLTKIFLYILSFHLLFYLRKWLLLYCLMRKNINALYMYENRQIHIYMRCTASRAREETYKTEWRKIIFRSFTSWFMLNPRSNNSSNRISFRRAVISDLLFYAEAFEWIMKSQHHFA